MCRKNFSSTWFAFSDIESAYKTVPAGWQTSCYL